MSNQRVHPSDPDDAAETFPKLNIYLTVRLDADKGWATSVIICTPDGKNCVSSWQRKGSSLVHANSKGFGDLEAALEEAFNALELFPSTTESPVEQLTLNPPNDPA